MTTKSTSTKKITVLVADDHTIVRAGLSALLETESDITSSDRRKTAWKPSERRSRRNRTSY